MVKYSPLLVALFVWLADPAFADTGRTWVSPFSLSRPNSNANTSGKVEAKPNGAWWKAPHCLQNIFYLGDSYLDDGNYEAITGLPVEFYSDEPPWATDVNVTLGLTATGRWTPAGSPPNSLGNNYAVAGASIEGSLTPVDTSFLGQVNLMLSDYPHGLPADSLVVVAIGTNDVLSAMNFGGIWSINLFGWRLIGSGFTVPAVGSTVTAKVANTIGLLPGPNNLVVFPNASSFTVLSVTAVNFPASTVTLTNVSGVPGSLVSPNTSFKMAASYFLDLEVPVFAQGIKALLADRANLVLTLPWRTDFLPIYDRQPDQTLAYSTWLYLYIKMATAIAARLPQALYFDLSGFFNSVFFNYAQYGFLYNYPAWNENPNVGAREYVFWDDVHPSGQTHQLIANDFIQFMTQLGLVGRQ